MEKIVIYTDGACSGNPGPGGWGAILMYKEHKKEISGGNKETTNNIMEITAVLEALRLIKENFAGDIEIYSDSAYVVNAFSNGWIYNWKKNNWKTTSKEPVKNQELWEELYSFTKKFNIEFIKVKGHSDNEFNNRCDKMAREEIKKL